MQRGNVLVIGNSGVGKSTLINAVLGDQVAKTGHGTSGTTEELEIYESEQVPFRIIDTVGFEPSPIKARRAINAVKKWSKDSAKKEQLDTEINLIWFCVEGTSRKLFPETIKNLSKATAMWKTVPIIVVITKSYSIPERQENIDMVREAFAKEKRHERNLKNIIPVVASTYTLNDTAFAGPEGISDLVEATNAWMPEGIKAGAHDIYQFQLSRKKVFAQSIVATSTSAAVAVGAIPVPIADAALLAPIEIGQVNAIARLYGIDKGEESKRFFNSIVEAGTISVAAKTAISTLKAIPGINIGASVLNAVVAGAFVAAMGEGSIYVFEKIYTGEKSVEDIDWVKKVMESKLSSQFIDNVTIIIDNISKNGNTKDVGKLIVSMISTIFTSSTKVD